MREHLDFAPVSLQNGFGIPRAYKFNPIRVEPECHKEHLSPCPSFSNVGPVSASAGAIFRSPASAKEYPTFLSWWLAVGRLDPHCAKEWSSISGPHVMQGRTELTSEQDWATLDAADAAALKAWIENIRVGVFYD